MTENTPKCDIVTAAASHLATSPSAQNDNNLNNSYNIDKSLIPQQQQKPIPRGKKPNQGASFYCEFEGCGRVYSTEHSRRQHYRRLHMTEWLVRRGVHSSSSLSQQQEESEERLNTTLGASSTNSISSTSTDSFVSSSVGHHHNVTITAAANFNTLFSVRSTPPTSKRSSQDGLFQLRSTRSQPVVASGSLLSNAPYSVHKTDSTSRHTSSSSGSSSRLIRHTRSSFEDSSGSHFHFHTNQHPSPPPLPPSTTTRYIYAHPRPVYFDSEKKKHDDQPSAYSSLSSSDPSISLIHTRASSNINRDAIPRDFDVYSAPRLSMATASVSSNYSSNTSSGGDTYDYGGTQAYPQRYDNSVSPPTLAMESQIYHHHPLTTASSTSIISHTTSTSPIEDVSEHFERSNIKFRQGNPRNSSSTQSVPSSVRSSSASPPIAYSIQSLLEKKSP